MSSPSRASRTSPTLGAVRRGISGRVVVVIPSMPAIAAETASRVAPGHLLATVATVRAWFSAISAIETSMLERTSSGAPSPETTRRTGTPMFAATRALRASSGVPATSVKSDPSMMTTSWSRASARYEETMRDSASSGSAWNSSQVTPMQSAAGEVEPERARSRVRKGSASRESTKGRKTPTLATTLVKEATRPRATVDLPVPALGEAM